MNNFSFVISINEMFDKLISPHAISLYMKDIFIFIILAIMFFMGPLISELILIYGEALREEKPKGHIIPNKFLSYCLSFGSLIMIWGITFFLFYAIFMQFL